MHKTTILCQFGLIICHQLTYSFLHQFSTIFGGNCIILTVSSIDSQANQSNQSSIQRELLMPSPEVIDLTLSDDKNQPDPTRSIQDSSTPTQATNRFRTSSLTPPTSGINRTRRILPVIQGTFAAIERAENYLPLQPFWTNTHQLHPQPMQDWHTRQVLCGDLHQHIHSKRFCHKRVCED